jgi:ParB-like chromosome segregation protein Spo0J
MAGTTTNEFARGGSQYSLDPHTQLRIIGLDTKDGAEHPYYDERIKQPLSEAFVASIAMAGVLEPIIARRDGDIADVIAGRQRTRGARIVNERRLGKLPIPNDLPEEWKALYGAEHPLIRVPTLLRKASDREAAQIQIIENENRMADSPLTRAHKMKKLEDSGHNRAMIAVMFNTTVDGVARQLKVLDASAKGQKALEAGVISVSALAALTDLPRAEQDQKLDEAEQHGITITTSAARAEGIVRRGSAREPSGPKPPKRGVLRKLVESESFGAELSDDAKHLLAWIATGDEGHVTRVKGLKKTLREIGALPAD